MKKKYIGWSPGIGIIFFFLRMLYSHRR